MGAGFSGSVDCFGVPGDCPGCVLHRLSKAYEAAAGGHMVLGEGALWRGARGQWRRLQGTLLTLSLRGAP